MIVSTQVPNDVASRSVGRNSPRDRRDLSVRRCGGALRRDDAPLRSADRRCSGSRLWSSSPSAFSLQCCSPIRNQPRLRQAAITGTCFNSRSSLCHAVNPFDAVIGSDDVSRLLSIQNRTALERSLLLRLIPSRGTSNSAPDRCRSGMMRATSMPSWVHCARSRWPQCW